MAILILQHSELGTPGRFGTTLRDHGFCLEFSRPDLPASRTNRGVGTDLDGVEGLVIMGGPQNVTDAGTYPWMQAELEMIKRAHALELPLVGICLGAQLIAQALGGSVGFRGTPSLGFDTLRLNPSGQTDTIFSGIAWNHPQFFSCEQEVQKAPVGAVVLAATKSTPIAAFRVGLRTFGFQYHPECGQEGLKALARSSGTIAGKAGVNPEFVDKQIVDQYQTYARLSERLALNVVTYCFPLERRRTA
jgi:GMP synthase-like glutamine amidotransferase